jgi:hypothetical protein
MDGTAKLGDRFWGGPVRPSSSPHHLSVAFRRSRDGAATVAPEDDLHDTIEARVASLRIEGDAVDTEALEAAISEVLEFTRRVLFERPAA